MSRNTDSAVTSASQSAALRFRVLVNIQSLSSGNFYACTGDRFIYTMGNTYTPVGALGGLDAVQEEPDPFPRSVRAWISLANSAAVTEALNESLYRKPGVMHRVFLSQSYTVQGTPQIIFKGVVDRAEMGSSTDRGNYLEVEFESRLKQMPQLGYFTRDIFQLYVSTTSDTFLNYQNDMRFFVPAWGRAFQSNGSPWSPIYSPGVPTGPITGPIIITGLP